MTTTTLIVVIFAVVVVALLAWYLLRMERSKKLRSKFGPEYDHALHEYGNQTRAENALVARQKRLEKVQIRALSTEERNRFGTQWHEIQAHFVDDPAASIRDADQLVNEVMNTRGYPMTEFDNRIEDLSVDHPHVVRNYRAAHEIARQREMGKASTEDLRKGLVYYRDLFDELLEAQTPVGSRGRQ